MDRTYKKSELAKFADVSYSSFNRFLRHHREELDKLGSPLKAQKVRGKALEYICENYDIVLPDEQPPFKHTPFR